MKIFEIIQEYGAADIRVRSRSQNYDYAAMKRAQNRASPGFDPDSESNPEFIPDRGTDSKPKPDQDPDKKFDQGWYSGGRTNPRDPHEFVKKPHLTTKLDKDAYYKYVEEINKLKQKGYTNPFFPQVYNVDITQDPRGNQRPRYRIEKLQQGENFSDEALLGMYERLFNNDIKIETGWSSTTEAIWYAIASEVNKAAAWDDYANIKDKKLKQALMLIADIVRDHPDWNVDLHQGNIRVRGSSLGPHLVLMDPISDGGNSIPDEDDVRLGANNRTVPAKTKTLNPDLSSFGRFAMGDHKPKKKRPGLGTMLKNKLDQQEPK